MYLEKEKYIYNNSGKQYVIEKIVILTYKSLNSDFNVFYGYCTWVDGGN
jgi:hypothetical protein